MFKRKVKVKDNRFIEMVEEFLGKQSYLISKKGELTSEELAAFRYELGDYKVNLYNPTLIKRIGINELFCPLFSILTIKNTNNTFSRLKRIADYSDVVPLLNQRLIFFTADENEIQSIKIYIPDTHDIIIHLNYLSKNFIREHFDFRDLKLFVPEDGTTLIEPEPSKEYLAFTKHKIKNSTIILHHAP